MEINGASQSSSSSGSSSTKTNSDALANKEVFLQMLVAQIKNQDPLNPTDGVQYMTQLAQFSQLEQLMGIRQDLSSLKTTVADAAATDPATTKS